jgi:hypothetical protein
MIHLAAGQLAYVGPESLRTTGDIDMEEEAVDVG